MTTPTPPTHLRILSGGLAAVLLAFLSGCGGGGEASGGTDVDQLIKNAESYTQSQQDIANLDKEKKQVMAQLPLAQKKLEAAQQNVENLKAELDSLGTGEDQAYEDLQSSLQDAPPDVIVILSERFVRDFPLSAKAASVQQQLATSRVKQQEQEKQLAAQEQEKKAQEAARRQARLEKFKNGQMSTVELKAYLGGKSEAEIIQLMGLPTSKTRHDTWEYNDRYGLSNTGKRGRIRLYFMGGRVNSVGLY